MELIPNLLYFHGTLSAYNKVMLWCDVSVDVHSQLCLFLLRSIHLNLLRCAVIRVGIEL